ncbi:transposase [Candidatus Calescamantes bacterium]|nr:transposase [Candidatus Calescamantes bacterium]
MKRRDKGKYNFCSMYAFRLFPQSLPKIVDLSKDAKRRLKWFDYYNSHEKNVYLTCRYFGISRKTFYKWLHRYNPYDLSSLESRSRAPLKKRKRDISFQQELKIRVLRRKHIRYGKEKLKILYEREHGEKISNWKIQKETGEKYNLYWHPIKNEKLRKRRKLAQKKKRITELKNKVIEGFFFQLDTIVIWWNGVKRYIFTAVDRTSRIGFARVYKSITSFNARDFLYRLWYLVDGKITIVQSDNGSEFAKLFEEGCKKLEIEHYYSRVRTPQDNGRNVRFNRTLKDEFIQLGNFYPKASYSLIQN